MIVSLEAEITQIKNFVVDINPKNDEALTLNPQYIRQVEESNKKIRNLGMQLQRSHELISNREKKTQRN